VTVAPAVPAGLAKLLPAGAIIDTDRFFAEFYAPEQGQHHAFLGPNGCGKTTMAIRCLVTAREMHPAQRAVALAMKPDKGPKSDGKKATGDLTVAQLTRRYGGRIIRTFPPVRAPWQKEPTFWTFWPRHTMRPKIDRPAHTEAFGEALLHCYNQGDWWVFADEVKSLDDELGLEDEVETILTKGRSMKCGGMFATQRPANVTLYVYTESKHFFMWRVTDERAYERLAQIGGGMIDKRQCMEIMKKLRKHDCLYLYPEQGVMAVLV